MKDTDHIKFLITLKKEKFGNSEISKSDFEVILNEISEQDEEYCLDQQVIDELYRVLEEKQNGIITMEGVEALILQCLLEEQHVESQLEGDDFSEYQDLTLDSINQLRSLFLKAAGSLNKEKCLLVDIEKQIRAFNKKGSLLMKAERAQGIFQNLASQGDQDGQFDENKLFVFNEDIQQFVSKFENFLLLKSGQAQVENEEHALVFHESEDENGNDDNNINSTETNSLNSFSSIKVQSSIKRENSQKQISYFEKSDQPLLPFPDENETQPILQFLMNIPNQTEVSENQVLSAVEQLKIFFQRFYCGITGLMTIVEEKDSLIEIFKQQSEMKAERIKMLEITNEQNSMTASDLLHLNEKLQDEKDKLNLRLEQQCAKSEQKNSELYKNLNANYQELQNKDLEIAQAQARIESLAQQNKELQLLNQNYSNELEKKEKEISLESQNSRDFSVSDSISNHPLPLLISQASLQKTQDQSRENIQLLDEIEQLKVLNEQLQSQITNYEHLIEKKEETIDELHREIIELKKTNEKLVENIQDLSQQFEQARFKASFNPSNNNLRVPSLNIASLNGSSRHSLQQDTQQFLIEEDNFSSAIAETNKNNSTKLVQGQKNRKGSTSNFQDNNNNNDDAANSNLKQQQICLTYKINEPIVNDSAEQLVKILPAKEIPKIVIKDCDSNNTNSNNNNTEIIPIPLFNFKNTGQNSFRDLTGGLLKGKKIFNQAAIEVIQSSRELKKNDDALNTPKPFSYLEQLNQLSPQKHTPSTPQQTIQLPPNITSLNLKENSCDHVSLSNTSAIKVPSFQQVLKGDVDYFWDEVRRNNIHSQSHLQSPHENKSQYFTSPPIKPINDNSLLFRLNSQSPPRVAFTDYLNLKNDSRLKAIVERSEKLSRSPKKNRYLNSQNEEIMSQQSLRPSHFSLISEEFTELAFFYSDSIYRINASQQKERRILCATTFFVYIINPNSSFKVVRKIDISKINKLTFSNANSNLFVIHVLNQPEYVIESCRRFDFNIFLRNLFRNILKIPIYMVSFIDHVQISDRRKTECLERLIESKQIEARNSSMTERTINSIQSNSPNKATFQQDINVLSKLDTKKIEEEQEEETPKFIKQNNHFYSTIKSFQVMIKKEQNIIQNLFKAPWKPCQLDLDTTSNEIKIKEGQQSNTGISIIFDDFVQLTEGELQITSTKGQIFNFKAVLCQDYQSLINHLTSMQRQQVQDTIS